MQTKRVPSLLTSSPAGASDLTARALEPASVRVAPFTALSARHLALCERQAGLASLSDDSALRPSLTHGLVDQRLHETARLVAELLGLAEHLDEQSRTEQGEQGWKAMRLLADASFDAILQLDAARQELAGSVHADARVQRAHRDDALRCARAVLSELERQLAQALAN